ncbi:cadmium-translocating P-type ATPase [Exilibacterium tricleocarpae]|uniref:Cadmium-translocating P-type ATPase n=1 Tax=Exilibacterium tricleocarpae TaxID=2591008 RepID=A0A545U5K3_9GAMM|nr:heavy metal translocating P-type ATPase [Exilibacterium tricleocarpae]TQV84747.1 cadmium-translocating P-type ATPase [Exilibacterium tricleocarpae]
MTVALKKNLSDDLTSVTAGQAAQGCYHCGLPVPAGCDFQLEIDGDRQPFCCPACRAVAGAIIAGGLGNFYQFRTELNSRAEAEVDAEDYRIYDTPELQQSFVQQLDDGTRRAQLLIEGITCAACVWLIEHYLDGYGAVTGVKVNAHTHRCVVDWQPEAGRLSDLMAALAAIGYRPMPATDDRLQDLQRRESRQALLRLGVAGIGMMQVGMVAIGLYAGGLQGIGETWEHLLRWVSMLIATPVVFYSARPFFSGALRVLRARHLSMDVPVAMAIGGAYAASCWATLFGGGEVYFDSVSMFTFFLLLGRYLEMRARHRNAAASGRLAHLLPLSVRRVRRSEAGEEIADVAVKQLQVGDCIRVRAGETFACDGEVLEGRSGAVEAMLTGEAEPVLKQPGDRVSAGTLNTDGSLLVEVKALGQHTQLSAIEQLVEQAQQEKPSQVALADRVAGYFVGVVLIVTGLVGWFWYHQAPEQAFWICLSVLVVTCPCALSLATPTALTTAIDTLRRRGLLVTRAHVVEGLEKVTCVVFDKTGTLTQGEPRVEDVVVTGELSRQRCLAVAAALETGSNHPLARAFADYSGTVFAEGIETVTGSGVSGRIDGRDYRLGTADFAAAGAPPPAGAGQWLALSVTDATSGRVQLLAWFSLRDQVRERAAAAVAALREELQLEVVLLSGDSSSATAEVAAAVGIANYRGGATPQDKLDYIQARQRYGDVVMMVGDGINDIPVLSGADVSVAMGSASDLAQTRADSILLNGQLEQLPAALVFARRARRTIRQNLGWAAGYNGLALPLAAMGWVPPYAAALGMSASSLVVVLNALRLGRR